MDIIFIYAIKTILLPPGLFLVVLFIGLLCLNRRRKLAMWLISITLVSLLLVSLPVVSQKLVASLERYPALSFSEENKPEAEAIVVLGGGRYSKAPEYGGEDTARYNTLERLRYTTYLHKKTALPILVSGGVVMGNRQAEAAIMSAILEDEFAVPVTWQEAESRNTAENAQYTLALLAEQGIRRIYLVTHAVHMVRAVEQFSRSNIEIIPAPMGFRAHETGELELFDWLPSLSGLSLFNSALHEYMGIIWYRLRYR